jgi:hypothetical protein
MPIGVNLKILTMRSLSLLTKVFNIEYEVTFYLYKYYYDAQLL